MHIPHIGLPAVEVVQRVNPESVKIRPLGAAVRIGSHQADAGTRLTKADLAAAPADHRLGQRSRGTGESGGQNYELRDGGAPGTNDAVLVVQVGADDNKLPSRGVIAPEPFTHS